MEKNIFEIAARNAFRFESTRGNITVEDLFRLSLNDLDQVAKGLSRKIKETEEESFVVTKTAASDTLTTKLDIVKFVIADRLQKAEESRRASEKAAQKGKILEVLERKQDSALEGMSVEELKALLKD